MQYTGEGDEKKIDKLAMKFVHCAVYTQEHHISLEPFFSSSGSAMTCTFLPAVSEEPAGDGAG